VQFFSSHGVVIPLLHRGHLLSSCNNLYVREVHGDCAQMPGVELTHLCSELRLLLLAGLVHRGAWPTYQHTPPLGLLACIVSKSSARSLSCAVCHNEGRLCYSRPVNNCKQLLWCFCVDDGRLEFEHARSCV